ncbi:type II toxin-antitoxin system VapC family toxin [Parapedobacter sp. DT-150]|uniref:type II toxin-antitoxin system VapC family toxin n=1 Tax=Parapedobacter sp. DT-150 TaxID=3396162 RepID=UPI003F1D372C
MVGNLLDTHAFIWFINGDDALSPKALEVIGNHPDTNYVSIASLWEIAVKISLGKLDIKQPFSKIADEIAKNGFQILPIGFEDVLQLTALTFFHKDPFDRLIIAQAITNKFQVISKDQYFTGYPVNVIW